MMRRLAAILSSLALGLGLALVPVQPAQAAIWGCSTGNQSKSVSGVVQYRAYVDCYGTPPSSIRYYRIKATYSILGTGQGDLGPYYGPWVKASSGTRSYSKWVAWPYWANAEGRRIQTKK